LWEFVMSKAFALTLAFAALSFLAACAAHVGNVASGHIN
jgi:hypothetical protein